MVGTLVSRDTCIDVNKALENNLKKFLFLVKMHQISSP